MDWASATEWAQTAPTLSGATPVPRTKPRCNTSRRPRAARPPVDISNFHALPDSALVALPVAMAVTSLSAASVWRAVQSGRLPVVRFGARATRFSVGALRALTTNGTDG